jgi:stage II sporulation protein D
MKNSSKTWLPKLKLPFLKPVKLKPIVRSRGIPRFSGGPRASRLRLAGGLFFTGLVLTQVPPSPLARLGPAPAPARLESSLWQSTGTVRQSIVELYRTRRLLIQTAGVADSEAPEPSASAAATPNPETVANPAPPAPQATAEAAPAPTTGKPLPRPAAPPQPAATEAVSFDPSKTIDTNLEMRVAIAKNVGSLEVATSVDGLLMDLGGENYCNLPAQSSFVLQPQAGGMAFGDCRLSSTVWLEPGEGGYVYVGDKWFKGRVLLLQEGGGLTAVNFVLMHDYLSSVVGSEMYVHWPLESLKAQAVAARSYALTHHVRHANRAYDLDNTQRYQAYLGIAKETNTTQAAVVDTTGEFISYDGGIVESLYAASDEIVRAAHGGNGMSQTGAMELASQGYSYTEILGNYYPGTSLSRLVIE